MSEAVRPKLRGRYAANNGPLWRSGFTLIEMMVSVTLVLIMMTLFAQVFQMAGNSISKQRGLSENDQRSRTLQTIIKADLDKRSFRRVYPFAALEDVSAPESYIGKRQGYFSISENNYSNKSDDVLQFTMMATIVDRNKDITPYYGVASNYNLYPSFPGGQYTFNFPNQPDADDAQFAINNTGLSTVAEVVYFVRNGNLYRRQLLIREPIAAAGSNPQPTDYFPSNNANNPTGNDVFDPDSSALFHYPAAGSFYNDYDYSAYFSLNGFGHPSAHFLGSDSLDNSGSVFNAIAAPYRRFGHFHQVGANFSGRPKEFADNTAANFIGRYTLQECSDSDFRYPQNTTSSGNIPTDPTLNLTLDLTTQTVIAPDDFSQGFRRGEDLLLPNVHAFDVQVWDAGYGAFVDIGDPNLPANADFSMANRLNASYGPRLPASESLPTIANACFDTWHPGIDIDSASGVIDNPPFLPVNLKPASVFGAGVNGWLPGQLYAAGNVVFPSGPPGIAGPAFPTNKMPYGWPFFYRCIQGGTSLSGPAANTYSAEPQWPLVEGLTVTDGPVVWQAVDNRKPLKAIKIEIRFVDPSTQQMRQLTIIHSFVD